MNGLTYDTGALIAAERGDRRMWALHRRTLERGRPPTVPAVVLVEAWRGAVQTSRLLQGCAIEALEDLNARAAGALLGTCSRDVEACDATVVEGAIRRRDTVVSGNRAHMVALAQGVAKRLDVIDV